MLLYLKKDEQVYYLPKNTNMTVGRVNCNINLLKDQSISRLHAKLSNDNGKIYVTDVGSSNGTYICQGNVNQKLEVNTKFELNLGDQIMFGVQKNIWKLSGKHFETTYTKLSINEKNALSSYASQIGLNIKREWTETCTYLTASRIYLTIKILCSIITGGEIVLIDYWKDCLECIKKNEPLPSPQMYLPPFDKNLTSDDSLLFVYNPKRRVLFREKIFIFDSESEYKQKRKMIEICGGKAEMLKNIDEKILIDSNVIVLQSTLNNKNNQIQKLLSNQGLRVIPDHEIIIAILCCDISKNCNPQYNFENFSEKKFLESEIKFTNDTQSSTIPSLTHNSAMFSDLNKDDKIMSESSNFFSADSIHSQNGQLAKDNNNLNLHTTVDQDYKEIQLDNFTPSVSKKEKLSDIQPEVTEQHLSQSKYYRSQKYNKRRISDEFLNTSKSKKQCLEESNQFFLGTEKDCEENSMDEIECLDKNIDKHNNVSQEFALSESRSFEENLKTTSVSTYNIDNNENEQHRNNSNKRNDVSHEFLSPKRRRYVEESKLKSVNTPSKKINNDSLNLCGWLSKSMGKLNITRSSTTKNISNESLPLCNDVENTILIKYKTFIPKMREPFEIICDSTGRVIKNYKKFKKVHPVHYGPRGDLPLRKKVVLRIQGDYSKDLNDSL